MILPVVVTLKMMVCGGQNGRQKVTGCACCRWGCCCFAGGGGWAASVEERLLV